MHVFIILHVHVMLKLAKEWFKMHFEFLGVIIEKLVKYEFLQKTVEKQKTRPNT
mgnify:CR=1 FL=1